MGIQGECETCGGATYDYSCPNCLWRDQRELVDGLRLLYNFGGPGNSLRDKGHYNAAKAEALRLLKKHE